MQIALISQSQRITDPTPFREMSMAITRQLGLHVARAYHHLSIPVIFHPTVATVPADAWPLVVVDNPDQAGALGYHTEDPAGPGGLPRIRGVLFVDPILDNGGTLLDGENSLSAVGSHEAIEMRVDPNVQLWADDGNGVAYAYEAADACETNSYEVAGFTRQVTVSNFVLPSWFDPMTGAGERVDFMGKLPGPFAYDTGGYVTYLQEGKTSQQFGREMAAWRVDYHGLEGTRLARRAGRMPAAAPVA